MSRIEQLVEKFIALNDIKKTVAKARSGLDSVAKDLDRYNQDNVETTIAEHVKR